MNIPSYDVKISRKDHDDAEPVVTDGALAHRDVGRVLWARGEAALIVNQLQAAEGAGEEFLERLVDGAAKRAKRLLLAEVAKYSSVPAVKAFVTGEPSEVIKSTALRDPNSGRLIGSTTVKYKANVTAD